MGACYWPLRCMLCGLLLTLKEILPARLRKVIADADVSYARHLAMSVSYAAEARSVLPLYSELILAPLQFAFAAWYRLEQRSITTSSDTEVETARVMMDWTVQAAQALGLRWGFGQADKESLKRRHDALMGGPLPSPS
ncbi:uncharacterized protein B0I36DRAFT_335206 [Microdochium trichocladiopsis]|uniref:Uncharacterized protein n=1 Tax=Microdochium trichocladiopsis TaxID=1682393 RepID=A0A9P8XTX2_9PEZI|nr:uncharacterized protein B0I36DRAFT_335206 [Microdochium trichocladiopsis]KAH7018037.1 hypothetical protein B0I36DRAFT_335206 [Microdochium trichocladiopsis]